MGQNIGGKSHASGGIRAVVPDWPLAFFLILVPSCKHCLFIPSWPKKTVPCTNSMTRIKKWKAEEVVPWLRSLTTLAEDLYPVPSINMVAHNLYKSSSRGPDIIIWPLWVPIHMWYSETRQTHTHAYTHKHTNKWITIFKKILKWWPVSGGESRMGQEFLFLVAHFQFLYYLFI